MVVANNFKALGGEGHGFTLVDPGTQAALGASLAAANENKKGWLGYYWAPTALLGRYKMTKLPFGVGHDPAEWDRCTSKADCPDPKLNDFDNGDVISVVTKKFANTHSDEMAYLAKRSWDNTTLGKVLAWMEDNQGTPEDSAKYLLKTYPDLWANWLPPEGIKKVQAALQ
jgi:glycine betaine/proline transport system substrate-binding protein